MTTFAVNNGWTPELIAQDKALKEKYGQGAHITPARTFEIPANMNKLDSDTVQLEGKKQKTSFLKKALFLSGSVVLGVLIGRKVYPMLKQLFKKGAKQTDEVLNNAQEIVQKNLEFEAGKNLIKETVTGDLGQTIYRYSDESIIAEKSIFKGVEGPNDKTVAIKLKDGKSIELHYRPNTPDAQIKFPEWMAWEDGSLDMGIRGASSMDKALNIFKEALEKNNIDSTQILAAMKQEFI